MSWKLSLKIWNLTSLIYCIFFLWGMEGVERVEMVAVQAKCLLYGLKVKHKRS